MNFSKIAILCILLTNIIIFVVIPLSVTQSGFEEWIYLSRPNELVDAIISNIILLVIPFMFLLIANSRWARVNYEYSKENAPKLIKIIEKTSIVFVTSWTLLFIISGGLIYRAENLITTENERSLLLNMLFRLIPLLQVNLGLIFYNKKVASKLKLFIYSLVIAVLFISGSRGYVIETILLILTLQFVSKKETNYIRSIKKFKIKNPLKILALTAFTFGIFRVFGAIQSAREISLSTYESVLWRLSEPYWFFAYGNNLDSVFDNTLFENTIDRILSIPGRLLGINYPFSIDGSNYILENWLNVRGNTLGVSLPLPYIGEGYLIYGFIGAALYQVIICIMILTSFKLLRKLPIGGKLFHIFCSVQIINCVDLYSSSITGAFNILIVLPLKTLVYILLIYGLPSLLINNKNRVS